MPANDFSGDSNCMAVWRFEDSPGFVVDSQGNNDLANDGADEENSLIKEGVQSALFVRANTDKMTITDANQDAGFPWRYDDGGSIEKDFSICGWFRLNSLPSNNGEAQYIISKYSTSSARVFGIWLDDDVNKIRLAMGHTSGTLYQELIFDTACAINTWYHFGITYNAITRAGLIRIWDDNASDFLDSDKAVVFTNATDACDVGLTVDARDDDYRSFDGYTDELVVFNRVLTIDEIDDIRTATFAKSSSSSLSSSSRSSSSSSSSSKSSSSSSKSSSSSSKSSISSSASKEAVTFGGEEVEFDGEEVRW